MKFLFLLVACIACCCELAAQDREFQVGDKVRFSRDGVDNEGTISHILGNGAFLIDYPGDLGLPRVWVVPDAGQLTLVAEGKEPKKDLFPPNSDSKVRLYAPDMHNMREWTDASGKFKIRGQFVERQDDKVTLQTVDGERRTIRLDQLGKADQQFIEDFHKNFGLGIEAGDLHGLMRSRVPAGFRENWSAIRNRDSANVPGIPLDSSKSLEINPAFTFGCSLDSYLPASHPNPFAERVVSLGRKEMASGETVLFGPDRSSCFAVIESGQAFSGFTCDLSTGEIHGPMATPETFEKPIAYNWKTKSLVTVGFDDKSIHLWKIGDTSLELVKSIQPDWMGSIDSAQFFDATRLVVVSSFDVALIDVDANRTLSRIKFDTLPLPQIAPNGRIVIGRFKEKIAVADMVAGKVLGGCSIDDPDFEPICISPDGKRLAQSSRNKITIWDLEKDKLILDFTVTQNYSGGTALFITNDLLLVKGRSSWSLVSIPLMSEIWNYRMPSAAIGHLAGDGKLVILCDNKWDEFSLITTTFPQAQQKEIIERLKPDELIVMRPGDTVSLDLAPGPMRDRLERMLTNRGIKLSANSELKFKLVRSEVEKFDKNWGWASDRTKLETVKHWRQPLQLALYKNNEKLWWIDGSIGNVDSDMSITKGMSFQSFFDGQATTVDDFLQQVSLGSYISRRPEGGGYGESNLVPASKLPK